MQNEKIDVLLIDDDKEDFLILKELLSEVKDRRFQLDWQGSFENGVRALSEKKYDAYLVDYRLGEKSGLDLLRVVQERVSAQAPVIILTGYGDYEIDLKAMEAGAADYLVKDSLTATLLERTIRYAISRAQDLRELQEREEGVRSLFNASFEGIILHSRDGFIIDINWPAAKIIDHRPESVIGTRIQNYFQSEESLGLIFSALDNKGVKTFPSICTRLDGKRIHVEVSAKPFTIKGETLILTSFRDISERMEMEAQLLQQDRLASIGLLASSLAHEIGTPLGVIRGRAEFLNLQAKGNELVAQNAEIIISQIDRVSKLIRALLTLARGQGTSPVGLVNLKTAVSEVMVFLSHEFERKGIQSNIEVPEDFFVLAEAGPLHQVFLNLFVNSVHAIEAAIKKGRANDHFLKISAEETGNHFVLQIADSGCGISSEHLKEIFKPFFTTKDVGVGTGLGLATTYRILEGWGGKIHVESMEGKGTTFSLTFQRAKV